MCTTCGCGSGQVDVEAAASGHAHGEAFHGHAHPHPHTSEPPDALVVSVERDLLARNDAWAERNRRDFDARGVFVLNLVSSPGSGKTTLLVQTARSLKTRFPVSVIEGDQQTSCDAERIRAAGVPGVQVNTGKGCHLDAQMVARAVASLPPGDGGVLFVENVGNLVCPAAFDLGEAHKVVVISTTEGEDKPLKYPDMFAASDLMLINKIDLLPYVDFEPERCVAYARRINPAIQVMRVSASTGEGIDAWLEWVSAGRERNARGLAPSLWGAQ